MTLNAQLGNNIQRSPSQLLVTELSKPNGRFFCHYKSHWLLITNDVNIAAADTMTPSWYDERFSPQVVFNNHITVRASTHQGKITAHTSGPTYKLGAHGFCLLLNDTTHEKPMFSVVRKQPHLSTR